MINLNKVSKTFDRYTAINKIDLHIERGSIFWTDWFQWCR